jgi:folate-dependent phosphoribosylglycinamide formyltransferase PurN
MSSSQPELTPIYSKVAGKKANAALFMSGTGSNGIKVFEHEQRLGDAPFYVSVVVTDNPLSNAKQIADKYGREFVSSDIKAYYSENGLDNVRQQLEQYAIDIGIFGGFEPLTNITADFPCINIHPGDLNYLKDGQRYLVGLHTVPIMRAIQEGLDKVRSSAIIATPYDFDGGDMDTGPLLGIGPELHIPKLTHWMIEDMIKNPKEYKSFLKRIQNQLKFVSDWATLPRIVQFVAEEKFALDKDKNVYFEGKPKPNGYEICAKF